VISQAYVTSGKGFSPYGENKVYPEIQFQPQTQKNPQASRVWIRGQVISEEIILEIVDNGQGFDLQMLRPGFGLRGIEERVQLLKGQFRIHSQLNQGTQVEIVIPYSSQQP
jgi:glucose-6-phosphate-specific signal transduction histidine kinase